MGVYSSRKVGVLTISHNVIIIILSLVSLSCLPSYTLHLTYVT